MPVGQGELWKKPVYIQRDKCLSKQDAGQNAIKRDSPGVSGTSGQPSLSMKPVDEKLSTMKKFQRCVSSAKLCRLRDTMSGNFALSNFNRWKSSSFHYQVINSYLMVDLNWESTWKIIYIAKVIISDPSIKN